MSIYFRFPGFRTKALTLSYDDGTTDDRKLVETINRYGIKCTFNLNSGTFGNNGRLSGEEAAALYKGHEIAVHTLTHEHLDWISPTECARQILEDRKNLEAVTGGIVDGMAYPFGLADTAGEPETAAVCGISYSRTTVSTHGFELPKDFLRWHPTCHHADKAFDELAVRFLKPDDNEPLWRVSPKLFYLWGHSFEFTANGNWELLEHICGTLGNKDSVWYATNGEIFRYITAFRRIVKSYDGKTLFNPTSETLYAVYDGGKITITPGSTVKLL